MWIDKYACEALNLYEELRDSLTDDEIASFRKHCSMVELSDLFEWTSKNLQSVHAYVEATPSQRKRKKIWQDPQVKPLLVWAACIYARQGFAVLQALKESGLPGLQGIGYRSMTAEAGRAYIYVREHEEPEWPFPGPSPFEPE